MSVVSRMFNKDTLVSLVRKKEVFYLSAQYGGEPASLALLANKWEELIPLISFVADRYAPKNAIPVVKLAELRAKMMEIRDSTAKNKRLSLYIQTDVEKAEILDHAPEDFCVQYRLREFKLERILPEDVCELGEGWLRRGDRYWLYGTLTAAQYARFRCNTININDLIEFTKVDLPLFRKANINIDSDVEYDGSAAFHLELLSCTEKSAGIKTVWHISPETIDKTIYISEHVLANGKIYAGIIPCELRKILPDEETVFFDVKLAEFLDKHFAYLKRWFWDDLAQFETMHKWIEPPYRWELTVRSTISHGIGKTYADPTACIGKDHFSHKDLPSMLYLPYARISEGWVRRADLFTLGIDENGLMINDTEMKPIALKPSCFLRRDFRTLGSKWTNMRAEGVEWVSNGNKHICAIAHLDFLLYWGISGGLLGGYEATVVYGISMMEKLVNSEPDCRIIVMGNRDDINAFREICGDKLKALCFDYDTAYYNDDIRNQHWDLIVLIEPDVYQNEDEREKLRALAGISSACRIGFFQRMPEGQLCAWDAEQLGYRQDPEIPEIVIRDSRSPRPLPLTENNDHTGESYIVESEDELHLEQDSGAMITTVESSDRCGIAIPKREKAYETPVTVSYNDYRYIVNEEFFNDARKLVSHTEASATLVPFMHYWPKYSDMDKSQRKWYFYLRSQLRQKKYPQTDLSYIFVYVYEIINLIGVKDAFEGYQALININKAYGDQYAGLRRYLNAWIYDYVHVYDCGISPCEIFKTLPEPSQNALNEMLTAMANSDRFELPVWVLERLSTYRITGSKFYQSGHQETVDKCIPGALTYVDEQLRKKKGKGLLNTYAALKVHTDHIMAFGGALCEKQMSYTVKTIHYQNGSKLCNYLKNVVRYAENSLRSIMKFKARLQGVSLDAQSMEWIDTYLTAQINPPKPTPVSQGAERLTKIILNIDKINQLRSDSDEVREALIASMREAVPDNTNKTDIPRPQGTGDCLLTDLVPVSSILARLSSDERALINHFFANGWRESEHVLRDIFPGCIPDSLIDRINESSQTYLGISIIECEDDIRVVAEDYRDELEYLLPNTEDNSEKPALPEDIDDEWKNFFGKTDPDILAVLVDSMDKFVELAKQRGDMPEMLLDEINNTAMDTIGDLIVSDGGINEEYLPILQKYLQRG